MSKKQIEEIKNFLHNLTYGGFCPKDCFKCYNKISLSLDCECIVNEIYEQGYRKINENEVVINKEEYEELKQAKSLLEFREETIKSLEDANIRYAEALELKVNKKERKEMAEKIFRELIKRAENISFFDCRTGLDLDELAKQFDIKIGE